ncbi:MAG: hypothetical protein ACYTGC_04625, partial [Planctomycetota bacterium]
MTMRHQGRRLSVCGVVGLVLVGLCADANAQERPPLVRSPVDELVDFFVGPTNDECANATPIEGEGVFFFDNAGATMDGSGDCDMEDDVWLCWTAPCTGIVTASTCGRVGFDSVLAVYDGCGCPTRTLLYCNDDACANDSAIGWRAVAGDTYLIRIGSFSGGPNDSGPGSIVIECSQGNGGADNCAEAEAISGEGVFGYDDSVANVDGLDDCGQVEMESDVWFCWTAECDAVVTLNLCGRSFDPIAAVYEGCACPGGAGLLVCNDDNEDCLGSLINWNATAGNTYLIRIGSIDVRDRGPGAFSIECAEEGGADLCGDAVAISGEGIFSFDTNGADSDGNDEGSCESAFERDVWFCWTADCTGIVTLSTCDGTTVDAIAAVYDGCGCPTGNGLLDCNEDIFSDPCELGSFVAWQATAGSSYLIRIGDQSEEGKGKFTITCTQGDGGADACGDAEPISGEGVFGWDNRDAEADGPGGDGCEALIGSDVWYCWTATCDGPVTASLCGQATIDTVVAVYFGCVCPSGDGLVECNDDAENCELESFVAWNAVAGSSYLIRIGEFSSGSAGVGTGGIGSFTVTTCTSPPGTGACCFDPPVAGNCTDGLTQEGCEIDGGVYQGDGTTCADVDCAQPLGACCLVELKGNGCEDLIEDECLASGGIYQGDGTTCAEVECAVLGACCVFGKGVFVCEEVTPEVCAQFDGLYFGDGTLCADFDCPPEVAIGACCFENGSSASDCVELTQADCIGQGGLYQGDGTICADTTCVFDTGACCWP